MSYYLWKKSAESYLSDIEAIAGVGATARPSLGPGVYPRSSMTQTVYVGLDIHASRTGRIVLPREVDQGYIDLLSLSEEIEEKQDYLLIT